MLRILGIDPGLRRTGFGVIDAAGMRISYVGSGTIVVPSDIPLHERLKVILDSIREVVDTYSPTESALEKVFVNTNPAPPCCWARRVAPPCARWRTGIWM